MAGIESVINELKRQGYEVQQVTLTKKESDIVKFSDTSGTADAVFLTITPPVGGALLFPGKELVGEEDSSRIFLSLYDSGGSEISEDSMVFAHKETALRERSSALIAAPYGNFNKPSRADVYKLENSINLRGSAESLKFYTSSAVDADQTSTNCAITALLYYQQRGVRF